LSGHSATQRVSGSLTGGLRLPTICRAAGRLLEGSCGLALQRCGVRRCFGAALQLPALQLPALQLPALQRPALQGVRVRSRRLRPRAPGAHILVCYLHRAGSACVRATCQPAARALKTHSATELNHSKTPVIAGLQLVARCSEKPADHRKPAEHSTTVTVAAWPRPGIWHPAPCDQQGGGSAQEGVSSGGHAQN
jgi:hypothetical protein